MPLLTQGDGSGVLRSLINRMDDTSAIEVIKEISGVKVTQVKDFEKEKKDNTIKRLEKSVYR